MIGQTLGHYRIESKLGEGGMGAVWKARDIRLDRFVALKTLPAEKLADEDRRRRFVQEAKAASALNHPNIVHIYDIADADAVPFIAMEYVAGKTLDQLIGRKGLRVGESLKYAVQIADALARAHSAGIIHRDLKPSNIMVDEHGLVKVLDFGLAKLTETAAGELGETATMRVREGPDTEEGAIVGTVAYMSPEQAEGKPVDARSDIFSFGSVLYEMATGRRAFHGDSKLSTLSAILKEEPKPVSGIVPDVPRDLEKAISRCLRKDPARRFQHMDDVKVALEELKEESESGQFANASGMSPILRKQRWKFAASAGALATVVAAGLLWFLSRSAVPPAPLKIVPLTSYPGSEHSPSFSPDGNQVAFSWNGEKQDNYDIYVKLVDGGTPLRLTTNSATDVDPAWSPDGRQIAFLRRPSNVPTNSGAASIFLISPLGGAERKVSDARALPPEALGFEVSTPAWTRDGKSLAFTDRSDDGTLGIFLLSIVTGEKRRLTSAPVSALGDGEPAFSPDGRSFAFVRWFSFYQSDLYVASLVEKGEPQRLTQDNRGILGVAWSSNGDLVFSSSRLGGRSLWRVPAKGSSRTQPTRLAGVDGDAQFPVIFHGSPGAPPRLAYERHVDDTNIWRAEVRAARMMTPPIEVVVSTQADYAPRYSRDGNRIAFVSDRSGTYEIWICAYDGSAPAPVTSFGGPVPGSLRWSPDGQQVAFDLEVPGGYDIYVVGVGGGPARRLAANGVRPSWSHDGHWIYFGSNRSGGYGPNSSSDSQQVWRIPVTGGQPVQVTSGGGFEAVESPDGKTLFFTGNDDALWSMPVSEVARGGLGQRILPEVLDWAVAEKGIYFNRTLAAPVPVFFFSFETRQVTQIGTIPKALLAAPSLSVTLDGRWLIWAQIDRSDSDLVMLENFQ